MARRSSGREATVGCSPAFHASLIILPADDSRRVRYVEIFRPMASELVKRQQSDGLWRTNLDDPQELTNPETSGTGFFCYGLAWGINRGILDQKNTECRPRELFQAFCGTLARRGRCSGGKRWIGSRILQHERARMNL